jgi:hypothetical protein
MRRRTAQRWMPGITRISGMPTASSGSPMMMRRWIHRRPTRAAASCAAPRGRCASRAAHPGRQRVAAGVPGRELAAALQEPAAAVHLACRLGRARQPLHGGCVGRPRLAHARHCGRDDEQRQQHPRSDRRALAPGQPQVSDAVAFHAGAPAAQQDGRGGGGSLRGTMAAGARRSARPGLAARTGLRGPGRLERRMRHARPAKMPAGPR